MQQPQQEAPAKPPGKNGKGRNRGKGGAKKDNFSQGGKGEASNSRVTFPWINGQIISAAETGNLNHLVGTIDTHLSDMNLVNLSTALHRLAKMTATDYNAQMQLRRTLMPKLLFGLRESLKRAIAGDRPPKSQALSNITWALASMQLPDIPLVEMLAVQTSLQLADFKHFELSTTLWAFAKLGSIDAAVNKYSLQLFAAASEYIITYADQFTFRGLVMTSWAFATAKQHDARLFRAIAVQLMPAAHTANCQELANTAWAFSTAGVHKERLFNRLAEEAIPRLSEFKAQELSSILWSFASIGFSHEAFFEAASVIVQTMQLQAQQLANILWALTRVRAQQSSTQIAMLRLLPRCTELIKTFKPQELASVCLAAAKCFGQRVEDHEIADMEPPGSIPHEVSTFFLTVLPMVAPDLSEFSGQSVANIANSFLSVQIGLDSELFQAVGYEVMIRAEKLETSALLLLLKTLPQAPRCAPVQGAVMMLFGEAARRINILQPREVHILSRVCSVLMGGENAGTALPHKELLECCLTLAKPPGMNPAMMDPNMMNQLAQQEAQHMFLTKPASPSVHAATMSPPPGSWYDQWNAPMTVEVANTGRNASAWDTAATKQMQGVISAVQREQAGFPSGPGDNSVASHPAKSLPMSDSSAAAEASSVPHFVFSVKNTFLDVVEAEDEWDKDDEEPIDLPPPLDFIPNSVSPEKLAAYRADYARFRVGNAIGAKGEVGTSTAGGM